jgi:hypothetical protein
MVGIPPSEQDRHYGARGQVMSAAQMKIGPVIAERENAIA